jgi:hypothetical protein
MIEVKVFEIDSNYSVTQEADKYGTKNLQLGRQDNREVTPAQLYNLYNILKETKDRYIQAIKN